MQDDRRQRTGIVFLLLVLVPVIAAAATYKIAAGRAERRIRDIEAQARQEIASLQGELGQQKRTFEAEIERLKNEAQEALKQREEENAKAILALEERHKTELRELEDTYRQELLAEKSWWIDKTKAILTSPQVLPEDVQVRLELLGGEGVKETAGEDADGLFYEAMDLVIAGDYASARKKLQKVLLLEPGHSKAPGFLEGLDKIGDASQSNRR